MCKCVLGRIPKLVLCVCVEGWIKTLPRVRGRHLDALLERSLIKVSRGNCQRQDRLVVKHFSE